MIRLLLADDHRMFRQGLRQILETEGDMEVIAEAGNGQEAVAKAHELHPDVVLMDINMPGLDGVKAAQLISRNAPGTAVIILTMYRQDDYIFEAIKAGARGYLLKDADSEELVRAIHAVAQGEALIDPTIATRVLAEFRRPQEPPAEHLTAREEEILRQVARGASNREIAQALGLSEKTVKNRLSEIFSKLSLSNRTEAALYAVREGLVSLKDKGRN
ncbi:MAG: response regulator transcription factor [Deinococcus sp.]|nr:response regulator transcription factor [Deinococcus sp.]